MSGGDAPMPAPSSTQQPSSTAPGLPDEGDRVVRELDVYLVNGELGSGAQTYLLQFPLRPPWRPYHSDAEELENMKLKPKVKRMQCEVPLDVNSRNYNENVEESRRIAAATLQSARVDLRTSFAAGFVEEDRLLLFPVDEALQLRPSLAHLDKEREATAAKKKAAAAAAEEEEAKAPELMQLTVQVKRRETEQQTEARLRSYAHLAAQEEADQWVPLEYHGESSELAQTVWRKLANVGGAADVPHTLSREQYLDAIVPGSSTLNGQEGATWAAGALAAQDMGRPASLQHGAAPAAAQEATIPDDARPAVVAAALKLFKVAQVANLEQLRSVLGRDADPTIKALAGAASDASLHAALISDGLVTHLRRSYFPTRLGNPTLDPLRDALIELLKGKERLKRSEIVEAARTKGIPVTDSLYSKVVKDLCSSQGAMWSLRG